MSVEGGSAGGDLGARIKRPRLKALYRLWEDRCDGNAMPSWERFDILEMREWIGNLSLLEVVHEPLDMVYRVFSTRVSEHLRRELTGRWLSESEHLVPKSVRDCYYEVVATRKPIMQHLDDLSDDGQVVVLERLVLPMSEDGKQVNMILVGY